MLFRPVARHAQIHQRPLILTHIDRRLAAHDPPPQPNQRRESHPDSVGPSPQLCLANPDKGFSDCGFELIAGQKVALGLERVDLVGGNGRDDVNEGIDDGSMPGQIEG